MVLGRRVHAWHLKSGSTESACHFERTAKGLEGNANQLHGRWRRPSGPALRSATPDEVEGGPFSIAVPDAIDDRSHEVGRRLTIMLDDKLIEDAQRYTGISETSELLHEALRALIQREVSRRLIRLGGDDPTAGAEPRRRSDPS